MTRSHWRRREEFALWGEITAIERNPALAANIPEADRRYVTRSELLKGVLQWTLDKEFKETHVSRIRRNLGVDR